MSEAVKRPIITPSDRLGLTFCLAIISHAIVVLGVTFAAEDVRQPRYNTMDIVLVQQRSKQPDEAKLLAQASLQGGGDTEEKLTPSTPLPPPFPDNQPEVAAPPPRNAPPPEPPADAALEATVDALTEPASKRELLALESTTAENSSNKTVMETQQETPKQRQAEKTVKKKTEPRQQPSASTLLTNSFKIASLSAEIRQKLQAKAERPKRKFISASTREYKYAAYMEAWRAKVERVGNLNYPEEARKRKLTGSLVLAVALNPDGSINDIVVRKSSGHTVLDDSAIRIVKLAAPYSPFPEAIHKETDILHITRTWQFLNNRGFR